MNRNGKIILKAKNKESSDVLKGLMKKKGLNISPDLLLLPRIRIDNVDKDCDPKNLAKDLQNPDLQIDPADQADYLSPVFKTGPRDRESSAWVCTVKPAYYATILATPIFHGFMRCRVSKFDRVTQCYRCFKIGHPAVYCREEESACAHCARTGHLADSCPSGDSAPRCANCGGAHLATDILCSSRTSFHANLLRRTDFGSINVSND